MQCISYYPQLLPGVDSAHQHQLRTRGRPESHARCVVHRRGRFTVCKPGRGTARQRELTCDSQAGGGIALARSEEVCERHLSRRRIDDLLKRDLTRRDIVSAGGTLVAGQVLAALSQ